MAGGSGSSDTHEGGIEVAAEFDGQCGGVELGWSRVVTAVRRLEQVERRQVVAEPGWPQSGVGRRQLVVSVRVQVLGQCGHQHASH